LDLKQLTNELVVEERWHCDRAQKDADSEAIRAINEHDQGSADRTTSLIRWLASPARALGFSALRGFSTDSRTEVAGRIIAFADKRQEKALHYDKAKIVSEFNKLEGRLKEVAPRNKNGKERDVTSLTSKALWCCYPEDVPIFDKNAVSALRFISRVCHWSPGPNESEYARFVDVWFRAYDEVRPIIDKADLSDCPYKIRVFDSVLWYLGQDSFYEESAGSSAS
jgi:hypothetical protein